MVAERGFAPSAFRGARHHRDLRRYRGRQPLAARRVREEILTSIRAGFLSPIGHRRPDLTARPLRFILPGEYLFDYAPDEKPLC